ncbi:CoA transferase [Caenimonas sedimenti]|uniref:CoA transferase n=1 Tax=Caenimonas sedimenti TaxID=2596921 RepID=A0A562ZY86_9BURK|nr:CaiB/BaiF CoA-transferase family protein [Caenimonas sedimenti]TWO73361.1 CoA transferase [Caenimonas sedimenti]
MTQEQSTSRAAPLAGVRILDLTRLLPGPFAAQQLADLGADVIKVEDTGAGDYANAGVRHLVNRHKRAIRIDLKKPQGLATLLRLCRDADVLVEGFRPGVMQRLGAGYDAVRAVNPRIVYCSISGFGLTGPLAQAPGHDINYAALAGVADQVGNAHGPALSNLPLADLLGGSMTAVREMLAALFAATRSGQGRHLDIGIADGVLAQAVLPLAAVRESGHAQPLGQGTLTGALACYGFYATADGRHVAVGALEHKFWEALCERLERADLAQLHRTGDRQTEERVREELRAIFAARPMAHWAALFAGSQACVTPVLRLEEALAHPHFISRGFSKDPPGQAPQPGEHTQEILQGAGFTADEIATLRSEGAIG